MKKILIALFAILFFVSCSDTQKVNDQAQKVIKFGTSADYPPFEFKDDRNEIVGFEIDLANEISKRLDIKFVYQNINFDGLIPALKAGKIDAIISTMSATEERKKSVDFTKPYYKTKNVYIRKKGSDVSKDKSELKNSKISAQIGTIQEIAGKNLTTNFIPAENVLNAVLSLKVGKIDVVLTDDSIGTKYVSENNDLEIFITEEDGSEGASMAFDKGKNLELISKIDLVVEELKKDGTIDKLLKKYHLQ